MIDWIIRLLAARQIDLSTYMIREQWIDDWSKWHLLEGASKYFAVNLSTFIYPRKLGQQWLTKEQLIDYWLEVLIWTTCEPKNTCESTRVMDCLMSRRGMVTCNIHLLPAILLIVSYGKTHNSQTESCNQNPTYSMNSHSFSVRLMHLAATLMLNVVLAHIHC